MSYTNGVMLNKLKEKIANGEVTYGSWFSIFHDGAAEAMTGSGIDWILIDTEHSRQLGDSRKLGEDNRQQGSCIPHQGSVEQRLVHQAGS